MTKFSSWWTFLFLRSNKDYDTLPLGIVVNQNYIITICLEPNAVTADFGTHNSRLFSNLQKNYVFSFKFSTNQQPCI
ncbi:hypothetical protein EVA_16989 [gut metagenome]|uniref:Uncharacterized protein n=1 Tax=gut metagenome TaxID=749906 RepID=J9C511_9ZZZZ